MAITTQDDFKKEIIPIGREFLEKTIWAEDRLVPHRIKWNDRNRKWVNSNEIKVNKEIFDWIKTETWAIRRGRSKGAFASGSATGVGITTFLSFFEGKSGATKSPLYTDRFSELGYLSLIHI